jgi:hypothetical protein
MAALGDYLDQLERELQASPDKQAEILREIRSHLELAVLDMERNGEDNDARLAQALARFGEAEHIGRELRQVHGRATWPEIGLAALPLLLFSWLPTVLPMPVWIVPLVLIAIAVIAWRAHWPLWWWA